MAEQPNQDDDNDSHYSGAGHYDDEEDSDLFRISTKKKRDSGYELMMSDKEKSRIQAFRFMVAGMLVMTVGVTIMAYFLLGHKETQNFETAYEQFARSLADAAIDQQQSLRDSMRSLANEVTGYAQTNNISWPFVYLPLWESYAMGYFDHSKGEFVGINNHVTHDQRESFINWTTMHYEEWIQESHMLKYGNLDKLNQDPAEYNQYLAKKAKDGFPPDDIRTHYGVRTAQSPPMGAYGPLMNLNIGSIGSNGALMDAVRELRYETLVTAIKPFNALPASEHQNFHTDSEAENPHSFMYTPVYERVQDPTSSIVATVTSSVAWDASMQDLLPDNVNGILCVVRNNCNQSFTYEVRGHDAFYLGDGDHHDSEFSHLEVELDLALHTHPNFTSTPGHCMYTMHIYPTDEFRQNYKTALPATFAGAVCGTFFLVAIVFFAYDWTVTKRNKELVTTAVRSHKVVAQLFPGEMKNRVLARHSVRVVGMNGTGGMGRGMGRLTAFAEEKSIFLEKASPLAQEYKETTIFFGDLAGFTKWSSTRSPEQVFELLETLYSTFDGIAKRREIFKVETIGDCYVAATGLPEPQKDHAVRICRFSNECMNSMNTLTSELAVTLGSETCNLKLRVGLHSGKITGGVLRGDKCRYQLFGDTMNTASRMESNGIPGRVHVSKTTADELLTHGKGKWLTPREDRIVAKGKGEMETFFVLIPAHAATTATSSTSSDSSNMPLSLPAISDNSSSHAESDRLDSENFAAVAMC